MLSWLMTKIRDASMRVSNVLSSTFKLPVPSVVVNLKGNLPVKGAIGQIRAVRF